MATCEWGGEKSADVIVPDGGGKAEFWQMSVTVGSCKFSIEKAPQHSMPFRSQQGIKWAGTRLIGTRKSEATTGITQAVCFRETAPMLNDKYCGVRETASAGGCLLLDYAFLLCFWWVVVKVYRSFYFINC